MTHSSKYRFFGDDVFISKQEQGTRTLNFIAPMHAPHQSQVSLRFAVVALVCLLLSQCAHSQKSVASKVQDRSERHLASKDPLTYCPKGSVLPAANLFEKITFVYLPDRRTRFYIPPGDKRHQQQALEWRASFPPSPDTTREGRVGAKEFSQYMAAYLVFLPLAPFIYILSAGEHVSPIVETY